MALLDDLFEGLATEKKEEDPAKAPDSEKKPQDAAPKEDEKQPDEDGDGEEAEKDSPLFPTGKDWEDFKAGKTRA